VQSAAQMPGEEMKGEAKRTGLAAQKRVCQDEGTWAWNGEGRKEGVFRSEKA